MYKVENKYDVFISYSHEDGVSVANKLYDVLANNHKFSTFMDREKLTAGERFTKEIKDAITSCQVFVLIWSHAAEKSDFIVDREINWAQKKNRPIIPFVVDDIIEDSDIEFNLGSTHRIIANSSTSTLIQDSDINRVCSSVVARLQRSIPRDTPNELIENITEEADNIIEESVIDEIITVNSLIEMIDIVLGSYCRLCDGSKYHVDHSFKYLST